MAPQYLHRFHYFSPFIFAPFSVFFLPLFSSAVSNYCLLTSYQLFCPVLCLGDLYFH